MLLLLLAAASYKALLNWMILDWLREQDDNCHSWSGLNIRNHLRPFYLFHPDQHFRSHVLHRMIGWGCPPLILRLALLASLLFHHDLDFRIQLIDNEIYPDIVSAALTKSAICPFMATVGLVPDLTIAKGLSLMQKYSIHSGDMTRVATEQLRSESLTVTFAALKYLNEAPRLPKATQQELKRIAKEHANIDVRELAANAVERNRSN